MLLLVTQKVFINYYLFFSMNPQKSLCCQVVIFCIPVDHSVKLFTYNNNKVVKVKEFPNLENVTDMWLSNTKLGVLSV